MEAPYTLATLPRLLDTRHGRAHVSAVTELRKSGKRKRNEVVVGLDGDSLSIYTVNSQSHALQTSYALAPQSYQCCPPTSIYTAATRSGPFQRDTFTILRNGPNDPSRRLVRYTEKSLQSQELVQPEKREYKLRDGNVLGIEALLSGASSPRATVTYEDGTLLCIDEDNSEVKSRLSVLHEDESETRLEYATFCKIAMARKGLFRHRQDLLAMLSSITGDHLLLGCFILRSKYSFSLRLCILDTAPGNSSLRKLDDLNLPMNSSASGRSWNLDASSGQLLYLEDGIVNVFDLSGITPRKDASIKDRRAPITAYSTVSSSTIVACSTSRLTLYDTKYGSDQGSMVIEDNLTIGSVRKRKHDGEYATFDRPELCRLLGANLVVLTSKHLLGVQLRGRLKSTRLSNVLGKATAKHLISLQDKLKPDDLQWYTQVEESIASGHAASLEMIVWQNCIVSSTSQPGGRWILDSSSIEIRPSRYRKALVVLGRLFEPIQPALDAPQRLHLRLISSNIIRWLAISGLLTAEKLSTVLGVVVTSTQIANTLADPSFEMLQEILSLQIKLPASFTIECLRLLIRSLDVTESDTDMPEIMNVDTAEAQLERESRSAENELSNALTALESGLESRSETMRLVFDRLNTTPALAKHLRQGLEQQDLLFFIHLLRMELAGAGWTARYMDAGDHADDDSAPSDHAISSIGHLLIAAVDAMGTAGWLITTSDTEDSLVEALSAEVAACIEGAYEAQGLHDYLSDLERFATAKRLHSDTAPGEDRGLIEVRSTTGVDDVVMPVGGRSNIASMRHDPRARITGGMTGTYQLEHIRV